MFACGIIVKFHGRAQQERSSSAVSILCRTFRTSSVGTKFNQAFLAPSQGINTQAGIRSISVHMCYTLADVEDIREHQMSMSFATQLNTTQHNTTLRKTTQPPVLEQWEEIVEGDGIGSFRGNVFGQRGLADGTAMTTAPVDVSGRKIQDQVQFHRPPKVGLILRGGSCLASSFETMPISRASRQRTRAVTVVGLRRRR